MSEDILLHDICIEGVKYFLNFRMGQKGSLPLEAIEGFSLEEVARLEKRFKKLDLDQSGAIRSDRFRG